MSDAAGVTKKKTRAADWFTSLRDQLCGALETLEQEYSGPLEHLDAGRFLRKEWKRPAENASDGGGGTMSLMKGRVFEKVGANVSTVHGQFSPQFAKEIPGADADPSYWASGISFVAHPQSPRVPAAHFNTRHIVTQRSWFGGGGDLTPTIDVQRSRDHPFARIFHAEFRRVCDAYGAGTYSRLSKWCDEYFFLKHRGEPRGVGGIFYDYLGDDWEKDFAFTQDVGRAFVAAYTQIVRAGMNESWTENERAQQLVRRGRYVEFNLLYDRGTKFGLMTGGNVEAILMSLPPVVHWP